MPYYFKVSAALLHRQHDSEKRSQTAKYEYRNWAVVDSEPCTNPISRPNSPSREHLLRCNLTKLQSSKLSECRTQSSSLAYSWKVVWAKSYNCSISTLCNHFSACAGCSLNSLSGYTKYYWDLIKWSKLAGRILQHSASILFCEEEGTKYSTEGDFATRRPLFAN